MTETLEQEVARVMARCPEVAASWLFGSQARGRARPDSDLDFALLLQHRKVSSSVRYFDSCGPIACEGARARRLQERFRSEIMTAGSVLAKLEIVRQNLEWLEQLPQASFAEFSADFCNLGSAPHRLQTTFQALIGVASYIVSLRDSRVPSTSQEAFEKLEAAGLGSL